MYLFKCIYLNVFIEMYLLKCISMYLFLFIYDGLRCMLPPARLAGKRRRLRADLGCFLYHISVYMHYIMVALW